MLPTDQEVAELKMMLNTATQSNPEFAVYLDQFKILRIAKENVKLGELFYRQAMKKMIRTQQENASKNSEENAKIQQSSMQAKAEGDAQLEDKKNQAKEKQILMQGIIELAKAQVPIPNELRMLMGEVIKNLEVPLVVENQQIEQQIQQAEMEQQQEMQQQQEGQEQQEEGYTDEEMQQMMQQEQQQ